ncbi:hypothetical protein ADK53_20190 [Streptomyces sp. WM6373]|nr:hypothetical protein ADK53_20190 [Streptomyces sp. WM6373]
MVGPAGAPRPPPRPARGARRTGVTCSICHGRAPWRARDPDTASASSRCGGSQHRRRTVSGVIRFSWGRFSSSASAETAVRAAASRAAAAGSLSAQERGGGGPAGVAPGCGSSLSGSAFARSTAAIHWSS